jgi:hypothetical protein
MLHDAVNIVLLIRMLRWKESLLLLFVVGNIGPMQCDITALYTFFNGEIKEETLHISKIKEVIAPTPPVEAVIPNDVIDKIIGSIDPQNNEVATEQEEVVEAVEEGDIDDNNNEKDKTINTTNDVTLVDAEKVTEHDNQPKIVTFTTTTTTVTTTITSPSLLEDNDTPVAVTKPPPPALVEDWRLFRAKQFLSRLNNGSQASETQYFTSPDTQNLKVPFNPVLDSYRALDSETESDDDFNRKPPAKQKTISTGTPNSDGGAYTDSNS